MRYQKVFTQIWDDEKFAVLTPDAQRFFLYLLTCSSSNLIGIYPLKEGYVCEDLKCLPKDFRKWLAEVLSKGIISYDDNHKIVLIKNYLRHNPITNPNQLKAGIKTLRALPKTHLLQELKGLLKGLPEGLTKGLLEGILYTALYSVTASDTASDVEEPEEPEEKEIIHLLSFDDIWNAYPKKDGKKAAERSFNASVKTEADGQAIQAALTNYLHSEHVLKGFIKNGSTWFANWRDWIPEINPMTAADKTEPLSVQQKIELAEKYKREHPEEYERG